MKLLLDENLPDDLRFDFGVDHDVFTVGYMNWKGIKNGNLLALMVQHSFDALITVDKSLGFQQSIQEFPVLIFVLKARRNTHILLKDLIPRVLEVLRNNPLPGLFIIR